MQMDKNIIKGNRFVGRKPIKNREFYGVVDFKKRVNKENGKQETVTASTLVTHYGTRMEAKREIERQVKAMKGTLTYFGAFKNKN